MPHERYRPVRTLSRRHDREVRLCHDALSRREVVVKSEPLEDARREARVLLALPRGVTPALEDLVWSRRGRLDLVFEHLSGRTLMDAATAMTADQIPWVAASIAQVLAHLHRSGWVHGDLKPQNIFVQDRAGAPAIRLLDLGLAIERFGDWDKSIRGGTPPFIAPEARRGWIVDGRADLYSLGMVLAELFPGLRSDPQWRPILDRMTDPAPARRHPDAVAVRDEVASLFAVSHPLDRFPRLGVGPLRGREEDLEHLVHAVSAAPGARVLVQGRPGTGLSRFLLETVLSASAREAPSLCVIDLSTPGPQMDPAAIRTFVDAAPSGAPLVLGIDDPSRDFTWIDESLRGWLRETVSRPGWQRLALPPLDAESFSDILTASLGTTSPVVAEAAELLHQRTDGDLRCAGQDFLRIVKRIAREEGTVWNLDPAGWRTAVAGLPGPAVEPGLKRVTSDLFTSLCVCARIGRDFPERVGRELLAHFHREDHLTSLCDHGYLRPDGAGRLAFVTRALWVEASSEDFGEAEEIDLWLLAHHVPDPARVEEVLATCHRAARHNDRQKVARILSTALLDANGHDRWNDMRRLLCYPGEPPEDWSVDFVHGQLARIDPEIVNSIGKERLAYIAAYCVNNVDRKVGRVLLEEVAAGEDAESATDALAVLAGMVLKPGDSELPRYVDALRRLQSPAGVPNPGLPDYFLAIAAMMSGDSSGAETLALRAARALEGSGRGEEVRSRQILAILQFERDPDLGIATQKSLLTSSRELEFTSQAYSNLALMYDKNGDPERYAQVADEGIHKLRGRISNDKMVMLRIHRAWAWAEMDRVDQAGKEAQALIALPLVQLRDNRRAPVRTLLGFCRLHRGAGESAIRSVWQDWLEFPDRLSLNVRWDTLRALIDAVLDLDAWDSVRESGSCLPTASAASDVETLAALSRSRALLAQAEGDLDSAAAILEETRAAALTMSVQKARARYLHHLGLVRISQGVRTGRAGFARQAAEVLNQELASLHPRFQGYHRARALLAFSEAQHLCDDTTAAATTLEEAISLSRRIEALGLLSECLMIRARRGISGGQPS